MSLRSEKPGMVEVSDKRRNVAVTAKQGRPNDVKSARFEVCAVDQLSDCMSGLWSAVSSNPKASLDQESGVRFDAIEGVELDSACRSRMSSRPPCRNV
jgi:hypothetical protein